MANKHAAEVRALGDQDLIARLEADKEELFNLRFQLATGQADNTSRIEIVRHDVARVLTILREREIERHESFEQEMAKADSEALRESREAQASGAKKGTSVAEMITTSVPEDTENFGEETLTKIEEGPDA